MNSRFGADNRAYAQSHPWIDFAFNLDRLAPQDFVHLGEALSKSDHIAGVPLPPGVANELHKVYLVKGIHATTQIEGNSLSEDEVRARVDGKLELPESQEYLGTEVDNIVAACEMVLNDLQSGRDMHVTTERIKQFNKMVLADLPEEDGVVPGKIRTKGVGVGSVYLGAPAGDCEYLLDQLCEWLEQLQVDAAEGWTREMGIIRAILAHLYIAWIHPFGNGNGRTARLIEYQLLLQAGFPSPACHLLSNYYNRTRMRYYQALRETSQGPPYPVWRFVSYGLRGFVEELREQLKVVFAHQLRIAWVTYVHEMVGGSTMTAKRRRDLVLRLPVGSFTQISGIPQLTPDLATHYAGKTRKTITRDVNALAKRGLVFHTAEGVQPNVELMQGFLPLCNQAEPPGNEPGKVA